MYVPAPYQEDRAEVLLETIRACSFGSLITCGQDGIGISHIPFVPQVEADGSCSLLGHLARANPQWRECEPSREAVASFVLDSAYISPSWYPTKRITGKMVPTWNYVAVEARGSLEIVEDAAGLLDMVRRLTDHHEAGRAEPWSVDDAPPAFTKGLLRGIVGIRLRVRTLTGAWKLDQKKSAADREGAIAGLSQHPATRDMADQMAKASD